MVQVEMFGKKLVDDKPSLKDQMNRWFLEDDICKEDIIDVIQDHNGEGRFLRMNVMVVYDKVERK